MIQVVDLQKSDWGGQYYVNVAAYLRLLGAAPSPREHECHVRTRATQLCAAHEKELSAALDLETRLPDSERGDQIMRSLEECVIPFLEANSTLPGLRNSYTTGQLKGFFVWAIARELFARG